MQHLSLQIAPYGYQINHLDIDHLNIDHLDDVSDAFVLAQAKKIYTVSR